MTEMTELDLGCFVYRIRYVVRLATSREMRVSRLISQLLFLALNHKHMVMLKDTMQMTDIEFFSLYSIH
jgi:hypothetical protein